MASAHDIAALMIAGLTPPSGNGDIGFHQGVIQSWDELSGVNTLTVNGSTVSNVKTFQTGIGVPYFAGDVVGLFRFQSTYFILGKVTAPGGTQANQIKSATVDTYQTTGSTSFSDLATVGPQVTVNIGSSRRCLVLHGARVSCSGNPVAQYIGGSVGFQVTGASSIGAGFGAMVEQLSANATSGAGFTIHTTKSTLLTSADGLNAGSNTFTCKYYSEVATPVTGFAVRTITVIPF